MPLPEIPDWYLELCRRSREAVAAINDVPDMILKDKHGDAVAAAFAAAGAVNAIRKVLEELQPGGSGEAAPSPDASAPPAGGGAPGTSAQAPKNAPQPESHAAPMAAPVPCPTCDSGRRPPRPPHQCITCGGFGACRYIMNGAQMVLARFSDEDIAAARNAAKRAQDVAHAGGNAPGAGRMDPIAMVNRLRQVASDHATPHMPPQEVFRSMWALFGMAPPGPLRPPSPLPGGPETLPEDHPAWKGVRLVAAELSRDPMLWTMMDAAKVSPETLGLTAANDPRRAGAPR